MRRIWLIFSQAVTVSVAVLFVVATLKPEWLARPPGLIMPEVVPILTAPPEAVATAGRGYSLAARRALPAVVSIVAIKAPPRNPGSAFSSATVKKTRSASAVWVLGSLCRPWATC
jgi:serine protease DegQ